MVGEHALNLLQSEWHDLNSHELRLLLDERLGRPGQYDGRDKAPHRIHIPLAREKCRVTLTYDGQRIVRIEPGDAFDQAEWDQLSDEIENGLLQGPIKFGRDYAFSAYRVQGFWQGKKSGVQILPPLPEAPDSEIETADHPFILEFPIQECPQWSITNHRRLRELRKLVLLLNAILAGRTNLLPRQQQSFWAWTGTVDHPECKWVNNFYWAKLGDAVQNQPSPSAGEPAQVIKAEEYFTTVRGLDGLGLRVPSDLDEWICRYQQLSADRREEVDRATFWLDMASREWDVSMSSSFAALVSVIESLINKRGPGSAGRFHAFLEKYAPGSSLETRRSKMYDLRSGILHGSELITIDQGLSFGWDPPWFNQRELHEELWTLTRVAIRNWLRDQVPTPT